MSAARLHEFSAIEAARAIRNSVITSEELVRASLARIREREPIVEAWAHLDPALALAEARARDAELKARGPVGPLHGVPVGIKDIIDTAALPTENGTPIFEGRRPAHDATVVANLRAAGAVILGKTVTTELAFFGPGKTRNPANPAHTPGGSSSGSAAAVADFHVPLALGTQTAGSIIRPASYCGVVGYKPSFGVVPRDGILEQSPPLDTIGGYARTVEDAGLLIAAMAGLSPPAIPAQERPLRLAFVRMPVWDQGEALMHRAMLDFVAARRDIIDEVALPAAFDTTGGLQRAVQFRDIAVNYGPHLDSHPEVLSAKLAEVIGIGRSVSDLEYRAALDQREPLYQALVPLLSQYDAILSPAAAGPAPLGLASTGSPVFNFLWTYLGVPALSLPLLNAGGLPMGVQMVTARGADERLLATASALMAFTKGA